MRYVLVALMVGFMLIVATACISIPTGDGGSIKLSKDGATLKTADGEEHSVKVDVNDQSLTYSGVDQDGKSIETSVGLSDELPSVFPANTPIPDGAVLTVVEGDYDGRKQYIVRYETQGSVAETYYKYRTFFEQAGYADIIDPSEGQVDEDAYMEHLSGTGDNHKLMVSIMTASASEVDKGAIIGLTYSEIE